MRTLAAFAVLVLVGACQTSPPEMTEAEKAQIEAEVRQELINRMEEYKAFPISGDVEGVMSFMTEDVWMLQPGMNARRDDLQSLVVAFFSTVTVTDINAELLELFVHGDAAYGIYEYSATTQMEGQEPVTDISNCFTRWEKEDGVWKFDRDVCGPRDAPVEG